MRHRLLILLFALLATLSSPARLNTGEDHPIFDEGENRYPNVSEVIVDIPDPRKKVTIVN